MSIATTHDTIETLRNLLESSATLSQDSKQLWLRTLEHMNGLDARAILRAIVETPENLEELTQELKAKASEAGKN